AVDVRHIMAESPHAQAVIAIRAESSCGVLLSADVHSHGFATVMNDELANIIMVVGFLIVPALGGGYEGILAFIHTGQPDLQIRQPYGFLQRLRSGCGIGGYPEDFMEAIGESCAKGAGNWRF